jgi:hypothetical protein
MDAIENQGYEPLLIGLIHTARHLMDDLPDAIDLHYVKVVDIADGLAFEA